MIFKNDNGCKTILKWWQEKCLEWCYDYPDNGRLGDQKYLDEWPRLFKKNIHISKNKKYFQAPWTYNRFKTKDKIIYHFHGLKINSNKVYVFNNYGFTKKIIKDVYLPYCKSLKMSLDKINYKFTQYIKKNTLLKDLKFYIKFYLFKDEKLKRYIFDLNKIYEKN